MLDNLSVLIVSGGGFQGLTLFKLLSQDKAIKIVLADCNKENVVKYFADRFYVVPPIVNQQQFIESLCRIVEDESIRFIFPATDYELITLATYRDVFAAHQAQIAVSSASLLSRLLDKKFLYEFLADHALPTLGNLDPQKSRSFPLIGRPRRGWGSKDRLIVEGFKELDALSKKHLLDDYVWQPYLDSFLELSIDFAINFSGEISQLSVRTRVHTTGGFSVISDSFPDTAAYDLGTNVAAVLQRHSACGVFNLQLIEHDSKLYVSDLNCRVGTSATFAMAHPNNPALFMLDRSRSTTAKSSKLLPSERYRMVRYLEEIWLPIGNGEPIQGLVFDLDDTLLDQRRWIHDKLCLMWEQACRHLPDRLTFLTTASMLIDEGHAFDLFDQLDGRFNFGEKLKLDLIQIYRSQNPTPVVFSEVMDSLYALRSQGIRIGILTDNPVESQKKKIALSGISALVDVVVYSREHGGDKPNVNAFFASAIAVNCEPSQIAMVGNNFFRDILGAYKAGFAKGFLVSRGQMVSYRSDIIRALYPDLDFFLIQDLRGICSYCGIFSYPFAT